MENGFEFTPKYISYSDRSFYINRSSQRSNIRLSREDLNPEHWKIGPHCQSV